VLDKIYSRIQGRVEGASGMKKYLFHKAFESAKYYKDKKQQGWAFWDYLVFGTVKGRVGGRVRCVLSGGAPLRPEVGEFLSICLGCPVIQVFLFFFKTSHRDT
jgi:long-chain acyl-CoA synthetase